MAAGATAASSRVWPVRGCDGPRSAPDARRGVPRLGAVSRRLSRLHLDHLFEAAGDIRLPSNGMGGLPGKDGPMRGFCVIFFMAASRVALSGHSTHEKATVSPPSPGPRGGNP